MPFGWDFLTCPEKVNFDAEKFDVYTHTYASMLFAPSNRCTIFLPYLTTFSRTHVKSENAPENTKYLPQSAPGWNGNRRWLKKRQATKINSFTAFCSADVGNQVGRGVVTLPLDSMVTLSRGATCAGCDTLVGVTQWRCRRLVRCGTYGGHTWTQQRQINRQHHTKGSC